MTIETTQQESAHYHALGVDLIHTLGLKTKRNGRVDTSWGDKSPEGLGRTVARIVHAHKQTTRG